MTDIISWDKAIGKKVRSSDDHDLGKIQSITRDYIQTKDGSVSKKYYYIPKYYIAGYDGDHIWVSVTKDQAKAQFEGENAPNIASWDTPDYTQRRTLVVRDFPDFESNIPLYKPAGVSAPPAAPSRMDEGVPLAWEKVLDKEVKSSDGRDLGKVKSIAPQYIEVEHGVANKKHYFVPKSLVHGTDGKKLFVTLTKDELKSRYERESPPSPEDLASPAFYGVEAAEQIPTVHGVPWMAKEPDTPIPVDYSGSTYNIPWDQLIHKHVRTTDNVEVGYVERIGNEFIVVREGVANVHIYYVPKTYIKNFDGAQLWIDAPSGLVRAKFELDREPAAEELRAMAREAPRYRRARTYPSATDPMAREVPSQRLSGEPSTVIVEQEVDLEEVDADRSM